MIDWTKQTEEAVKGWTEMQKRALDQWLPPLKQMMGTTPAGSDYLKGLDNWETAVRQALEAQLEWTRQWAEAVGSGKAPTDAWAGQTQELVKAWTENNQQIWTRWVEGMKAALPASATGTEAWQKQAESVMNAWQEAVQASQKAYSDWSSRWNR